MSKISDDRMALHTIAHVMGLPTPSVDLAKAIDYQNEIIKKYLSLVEIESIYQAKADKYFAEKLALEGNENECTK